MNEKWILNSSPIITFAKLERIALLEEMCEEMVIPSGVELEISKGTSPSLFLPSDRSMVNLICMASLDFGKCMVGKGRFLYDCLYGCGVVGFFRHGVLLRAHPWLLHL